MKTTVKERLILYLEYKCISKRKFEMLIGVSNGYINNMRKSVQPDKIESITLHFPDLNTGWLLTGNGEMLNAETKEHGASPCLQCALKDAENTRLKDKIIELQERLLNGAEPKKAQKAG